MPLKNVFESGVTVKFFLEESLSFKLWLTRRKFYKKVVFDQKGLERKDAGVMTLKETMLVFPFIYFFQLRQVTDNQCDAYSVLMHWAYQRQYMLYF